MPLDRRKVKEAVELIGELEKFEKERDDLDRKFKAGEKIEMYVGGERLLIEKSGPLYGQLKDVRMGENDREINVLKNKIRALGVEI